MFFHLTMLTGPQPRSKSLAPGRDKYTINFSRRPSSWLLCLGTLATPGAMLTLHHNLKVKMLSPLTLPPTPSAGMLLRGHHTISLALNVTEGKLLSCHFKKLIPRDPWENHRIYVFIKSALRAYYIKKKKTSPNTCISMIAQFPFKYTFQIVAGCFGRDWGKGFT